MISPVLQLLEKFKELQKTRKNCRFRLEYDKTDLEWCVWIDDSGLNGWKILTYAKSEEVEKACEIALSQLKPIPDGIGMVC